MIALAHALWQADSAFPSGSFAFSGGLEALGEAAGGAALANVLSDFLRLRWAGTDRVVLARAFRAEGGIADIAAADAALEAATLSASLRDGSRRNGAAFLLAHVRLGTAGAATLRAACQSGACLGHLAVMQGALLRALGLDLATAITVAGYAALASLVTASVRLGRIGAIEGQRALAATLADLASVAADPPAPDTPISGFLPLLDIAACRHDRTDTRLFAT